MNTTTDHKLIQFLSVLSFLALCTFSPLVAEADRATKNSTSSIERNAPITSGARQADQKVVGTGNRLVTIPGDGSLGTLTLLTAPYYLAGEEIGPAKGTIKVPAGMHLKLAVSPTLKDFSPLRHLRPNDLQVISFHRTLVRDSDFAYVAHLTGLRSLDCNWTDIGDRALSHIQRLSGLAVLVLLHTQVTDKGIKYLRQLSNLKNLAIYSPYATGTGLAYLDKLPNLSTLSIGGTAVSDSAMPAISRLSQLRSISASGTNISNAGLRSLEKLTRLEALCVDNTNIDDRGLAVLDKLTNLNTLTLGNNAGITDAGISHVSKLSKLKVLDIGNTAVSDESLNRLKNLPLTELKLRGTQISEHGLEILSRMKTLSELSLPSQISRSAITKLRKELPDCHIARAHGSSALERLLGK